MIVVSVEPLVGKIVVDRLGRRREKAERVVGKLGERALVVRVVARWVSSGTSVEGKEAEGRIGLSYPAQYFYFHVEVRNQAGRVPTRLMLQTPLK